MTSPSLPQGAIGQLQAIVRDERSALLSLVRQTRLASAALSVIGTAALGVIVLGGGRWLALPRLTPFVFWAGAIGVASWLWNRRRDAESRTTTPDAVAEAIEDEQQLRRGAIRVASEVADSGPLGVHAAAHATRALAGTSLPRAPRTYAALKALRLNPAEWLGWKVLAKTALRALAGPARRAA